MSQRLARRDWRSGGPRFKTHPRLTSQSWPSYQLNQLGGKAASDSTFKQLTTCGVSNTCTFLLLWITHISADNSESHTHIPRQLWTPHIPADNSESHTHQQTTLNYAHIHRQLWIPHKLADNTETYLYPQTTLNSTYIRIQLWVQNIPADNSESHRYRQFWIPHIATDNSESHAYRQLWIPQYLNANHRSIRRSTNHDIDDPWRQ